MELEGTQNSDLETEEQLETQEVEETSAEEVLPTQEEEETSADEKAVEETPPAYEPNFTYKYKDEEFQFDDKLKGLVKDKDTEQYVRDLVTAQRAHSEYKEVGGVRDIQDKLEKFSNLETEHTELNKEIDQLSGMLSLNNSAGFETFRQHLGISKDMVLKWASEEARAMEDPNFAQSMTQQRSIEQQNFDLSYQNQLMQNNIQSEQVRQTTVELESLLGGNEVAQAYDNLVGAPGSFKQAVIEHGYNVHQASGGKTNLSISEAVQAVGQRYQGLIANRNSGTNEQVAQNPVQKSDPQQTVVIKQEGKQIIPTLNGTSGTPAKKRIMSLAEMRNFAKTM